MYRTRKNTKWTDNGLIRKKISHTKPGTHYIQQPWRNYVFKLFLGQHRIQVAYSKSRDWLTKIYFLLPEKISVKKITSYQSHRAEEFTVKQRWNQIPNFPAVPWGLHWCSIEEFSVLAFASLIIALYFFHCAIALTVTSHCFQTNKINWYYLDVGVNIRPKDKSFLTCCRIYMYRLFCLGLFHERKTTYSSRRNSHKGAIERLNLSRKVRKETEQRLPHQPLLPLPAQQYPWILPIHERLHQPRTCV